MFRGRRTFTALMAAALVALATQALAQPRRIEGTVTDEHGRPVPGAAITVNMVARFCLSCPSYQERIEGSGRQLQSTTNESGHYNVAVTGAGVYMVVAAKESLGTATTQVALLGSFGQSNPDSMRRSFATANLILRRSAGARTPAGGCAASRRPPEAFKHSALAAGSAPPLARLLLWLEAVGSHTPGCADIAAFEVGRFSHAEIDALLRDVRELVSFLRRVRGPGPGGERRDRAIFSVHGRRLTLDELERVFYGGNPLVPNEMLRRGAVLHTDIAIFVPGDLSGDPLVGDGGRKGWRTGTLHWEIGRQLLDSVAPAPAGDAGTLRWYRAVSAYLLGAGHLAEALAHLERSRRVFPKEPAFLLDSAYLHQEFSSPSLQASAEAVRGDGIEVKVESRRVELQRAERFFRQALALSPDDAEARLRLAHTMGELGGGKTAVAELRKVLDATPDRRQRYLANLFLGRVEQSVGRRGEAERHFRHAAAIYPNAQSPRFGLSQLARQSGDRVEALRALLDVRHRAPSDADTGDPWFDYYHPYLDDSATLMNEMRRLGER